MIRINLDVMMARRKISLTELAERVGITLANLSILKTGKANAVAMSAASGCKGRAFSPLPLMLVGST